MKTIYVVTVRWVISPINPPLIDAVMTQVGDWIRVNAETWLLTTAETPTNIRNLLMKHLSSEDNWLVLPINPYAPADGWAPEWVWAWLRNQSAVLHLDTPTNLPQIPNRG